MALAGFVIFEAIPMTQEGRKGFWMSPGFVPLLAGATLMMLSLGYAVTAVPREKGRWAAPGKFPGVSQNMPVVIIMSITAIYVVGLLGHVSFFVATLIFHGCMFGYLRIGGPVKVASVTLLASVLVALLLPWLFQIPLP